jgi:hypothetical protein
MGVSHWVPLAAAFGLLWGGGALWNYRTFSRADDFRRRQTPELVALPRPDIVRLTSLGFRDVLADLYWVGAVHYFAEPRNAADGYGGLVNYLDLVNELAPDFKFAYTFGGMAIPWNKGGGEWQNIEAAVRVLERGIVRFPNDYFLRLMLAYDLSTHLKRFREAGDQIAAASKLPGAPAYLPSFASRLYVAAGDFSAATELAQAVLEGTTDPLEREAMDRRVKEVQVEVDIRALDSAIARYRQERGSLPPALPASTIPRPARCARARSKSG